MFSKLFHVGSPKPFVKLFNTEGVPCGESHIAAGKICHVGSDEASKLADKRIKGTWMEKYPFKPEYRELSDEELNTRYRKYPGSVNNLSDEQKADVVALFREINLRHYERKVAGQQKTASQYSAFESAGQWPDGQPFPKHGEKVYAVVGGLFGMPQQVSGTVLRRKDGNYRVKIAGTKSVPLTKMWKTVKTSAAQPDYSQNQPKAL